MNYFVIMYHVILELNGMRPPFQILVVLHCMLMMSFTIVHCLWCLIAIIWLHGCFILKLVVPCSFNHWLVFSTLFYNFSNFFSYSFMLPFSSIYLLNISTFQGIALILFNQFFWDISPCFKYFSSFFWACTSSMVPSTFSYYSSGSILGYHPMQFLVLLWLVG